MKTRHIVASTVAWLLLGQVCLPADHYLLDPQEFDRTNHPLPRSSNRFNWFSRTPPEDGAITQSFRDEFFAPLTTIVGNQTAEFEGQPVQLQSLGYRIVSWDHPMFPGLQQVPGLQFSVRTLRPENIPEVTDISLPIPGRDPVLTRVLLNRSADQRPIQPPAGKFRPSLFIDFNRPQRAVGLEFGYKKFQDSTINDLEARGIRLIARDANGQPLASSSRGIIEMRANEQAANGRALFPYRVDHKIGVRSQTGEIMSVELEFGHDGDVGDLKIVEQQVVLRIWHEILPPAASRQGTIAIGAVPPGLDRGTPVGTESVMLPFHCDRAVVLLRGMRQETTPFPSGICEMGSGFVQSLHEPGRGGRVTLTPFFHYGPAGNTGTESGLVYYSLLAWNSREIEVAGRQFSDRFTLFSDGGNALLSRPDPLPRLGYSSNGVPEVFRAETEARHGPLVAALNGYHFKGGRNVGPLESIKLEASPAWWDSTFLHWSPFDPARPARTMELTITSILEDIGTTSDRSFTGSILTGRSLRATPDANIETRQNLVWLALLRGRAATISNTRIPTFRPPPSDGARFHLPPGTTAVAGLLFPVQSDMAAIGLWAMQFFPAVTQLGGFVPVDAVPRAIEWELLGSGYDGKDVDWRATGAMELGVNGWIADFLHHTLDLRPTIFGVVRDWDFATSDPVLGSNFVGISVVRQGPPATGTFPIRNDGRAQMHLQWILPGSEPPQQGMRYEYEWRGQRFTNFADRAPLQLRTGEELRVIATYTPDPSVPPTAPTTLQNATLEIYPVGTGTPLVATFVVAERNPPAFWLDLPTKRVTQALRFSRRKTDPPDLTRQVRLHSPRGVTVSSVYVRDVPPGKAASAFSTSVIGGLGNGFTRFPRKKNWDIEITWTEPGPAPAPAAVELVAETLDDGTFTLPISAQLTR